ncbi:precorrin-3B synthase [Nocardioides jejuensis]|uniref:precorrin-3B synthase n=1 Tax=Nocardioides jejuensis TaxID=2502782 RepID=UPI0014048B3C|nr:precorrin-3B synthase [Nocardioides jejuensis]
MPRASADDRCPGAVRLHEAADGFVGRVRIPGGRISPSQLGALASLAATLGDGHLYLTSRGNVQLRGLSSGCGQDLADGLYAAGLLPSLTHDRVRNVVASPLGGLTGHPATDEVLHEFDEALLEDPGLVALSGRFLFGIDNGTGDVLALAPDVAVVLPVDGTVTGWTAGTDVARLAIAGELTAVTAPVDLAADLLIGAAHRFLALRAEHAPNAWRAKELPAEARAELAPGRPGPQLDNPLEPLDARHDLREVTRTPSPVGLGRVAVDDVVRGVVAGAPLGSAPAEAWLTIAGLMSHEVPGSIRFTPWRSVVLIDPAPDAESLLREHGFLLDDTDPLATVTACIGKPGCGKALADVRADAPALAAAHPGVRLHLSGCDRRCGHPTTPHLSAVADGTSYTLEQH